MVGFTLSPEQIRTAPPEVRRWREQELLATFGLQSPTAELDSPQLAAISVDGATTVLSDSGHAPCGERLLRIGTRRRQCRD
jgi:hypothetical protein